MRSPSLALPLVALLVAVALIAAAPPLGEADFKRMKIKELRQFLDDRGIGCPGCQEKSDFVKIALQHAGAAVRPEKVKLEVPAGTLWEVWAAVAKDVCAAQAAKKGAADADSICNTVRIATDSIFMQFGKRVAGKLKKKPEALLKTSWNDPYQQAGRRLLGKTVGYCLKPANKETCQSTSRLQAQLEMKKVKGVDFVDYLTNVGIENTNPMYEILKEKVPHDEL